MPPLTTRHASLCLFCTFRSLSRPHVLLSRTHKRYRTDRRPLLPSRRQLTRNEQDAGYYNPLTQKGSGTEGGPFGMLDFEIRKGLERVRNEIGRPEFRENLAYTPAEFEEQWDKFTRSLAAWLKAGSKEVEGLVGRGRSINTATRLKYLFFAQAFGGRFTRAELENQKEVADLRYPAEWFPATRGITRTVHLHVGPTNSGKTYHALKRLEQAKTGIYLGPLRLLAHEVYTRLNAKGRPCALVTGEEQRMPDAEKPEMYSCTVEMAPLNTALEVAVIDEIQMINHVERGWAWTQAFLGIKASEIHLCGEARTVPLIRELCALIGDKIHVHEYERLTPLKTAERSFDGQLAKNLQKGDCVVSFSVLGIHALRKTIEQATGKKCAIVYGSLPPETRAAQARLFNDPDNDYDFLVASDAIGMGLNLSIKRVVFESTWKHNGLIRVPLAVSEIKQIGGRAGRYRTAHQAVAEDAAKTQAPPADNQLVPAIGPASPEEPETSVVKPGGSEDATVGYVTTLDRFDFPYLKHCMTSEPEPIRTAGVFPPSLIVERFANYFPPGTPFSYVLLRLHEVCEIHPRFRLCALKDQLVIADAIHTVKNLSIPERLMICAAPTNLKTDEQRAFLTTLAKCIANRESSSLLDLPLPLEVLDEKPSGAKEYLFRLEELHKQLVLYLWLSYRFPNVFTTRALGHYTKKLVEDAIETALRDFSTVEKYRRLRERKLQKAKESLQNLKGIAPAATTNEDGSGDDVIPQVVKDFLEDEEAFASGTDFDDENKYPTPELDVLVRRVPPRRRGTRSTSLNEHNHSPRRTRWIANKGDKSTKSVI